MAKKKPKKAAKPMATKTVKKASDSVLFAFLATFLSIIGFIIALIAKKEDKYVMYYAKQSLLVFIAGVIVWIAGFVLLFIPILGWLAILVLDIIVLVLWLISWIYALSGNMKEVPIVGQYVGKINL